MKELPSRAALICYINAVERAAKQACIDGEPATSLTGAADTLRHLVDRQAEKPNVESLREHVSKLFRRPETTCRTDMADSLALVLRQVDELAEIVEDHLHNETNSGNSAAIETSLVAQRNRMKQMLAATEEQRCLARLNPA